MISAPARTKVSLETAHGGHARGGRFLGHVVEGGAKVKGEAQVVVITVVAAGGSGVLPPAATSCGKKMKEMKQNNTTAPRCREHMDDK